MLTLFFALIRFPSFSTPAVIVASGLQSSDPPATCLADDRQLITADSLLLSKALPVQTYPKRRKKLLSVDWLGQIFRSSSFQALFAVTLHRFRGQCNDGQTAKQG